MNSFSSKLSVVLSTLIVTLGLLVSASPAGAQTKKKAKRKPAARTRVVPSPVPQPVVISQADEYQNQNRQIITGQTEDFTTSQIDPQVEAQPETFDEKLDRITRRLDAMSPQTETKSSNKKKDYDDKQKRLALNLDILTKAEQRSESLRKQLFELAERENNVKMRLETIEYDNRSETIERQVALAGSLRPEELREMRRKNLEAEKRNLQNLLIEIQTSRTNLELTVQKAEQMVEKLRTKLEKDIDDALVDDPQ